MYLDLTVQDLMNGKLDKKYEDRVFWYASKVTIDDNRVEIYIDNSNLVTFDDIDLDIRKISEFRNRKQDNKNEMIDVLVSSGSFLFINNKLAVTQRELTTKFDPGFWTTPAGRCDRTILETGLKETIEEIKIESRGKILYPAIARMLVDVKENNEFYKTDFFDEQFPLKTYEICIYLDNIIIEECSSWMYVSQEVNTIEFRVPLFATLNEQELTLTNPEFGTDTGLKRIDELQQLDCVPALKQLLLELKNGNKK